MEALERRARHQGSVLVVVLEVGARVAIALELNDIGDRLTTKRCRLVHVVPHTAHADIDQRLMLRAPPVPDRRAREIRQHTATGPHNGDVGRPVGSCDVRSTREPVTIN